MKIKTLEWVNADSRYGHIEKAQTPFGPYTVFGDGEGWTPGGGLAENGTRKGDRTLGTQEAKLEEAKAWAQADFERRISECYEPSAD